MTALEEQQLRAMGAAIAGAETSPWEPRCIMQAFRTECVGGLHLTLQIWVDLEAIRSPLLQGTLPHAGEAEEALELWRPDLDLEALDGADVHAFAVEMLDACVRAFSMALRMEPPKRDAEAEPPDGFGSWAPIWACLVTQCGLPPDAALRMRVDQAHVLIATHRRNQGWRVAGTPYALRELELQQAEEEVARG